MAVAKQDRDEVFVEYTKSICPVCKVVVDAQVNIRDGKVYLRKRCTAHGWFEALVYGDAQAYVRSARFNKPGTIPLTVVPIPRLINVDDYLDYVTNRVLPDPAVPGALERLCSASAFMGAETTTRSLELTAMQLEWEACGIDLPKVLSDLDDRKPGRSGGPVACLVGGVRDE